MTIRPVKPVAERDERHHDDPAVEKTPALPGPSTTLTGTARFDATGDVALMPSWEELVAEHADRVYRLMPIDFRATSTMPKTSPRRLSSGCSARSPATSRARSRDGCTASPPTCSSTWCADARRSAWRRCPGSRPCPRRQPDPQQIYADANLDPYCRPLWTDFAPEFPRRGGAV